MADDPRYVPAAGRPGLTRLYDPAMALTMREKAWRPALRDLVLADLPTGGTVVEVGAGTGTFSLALAAARPDAEIVAIDGDPGALALALAKPGADRVSWREAMAAQLPLDTASADAAVMSLLLHHLDADDKRAALAEAHRVLRPGGRLHIADWGRPRGALTQLGFLGLRLLDGFANTSDHNAGRIPEFIATAGLEQVACRKRLPTAFGTLEILTARRGPSS